MSPGGSPVYAVFVSPHGFGHAARASAVMASLREREGARFELFATTPAWFFDEAVAGAYTRHPVVTDVGLRQRSALEHDVGATVEALDALLPFDEAEVEALAATVARAGARAVLCDIAPLGIAVAERAGLPSLLLENFTWPWLYEPLAERAPALAAHARTLDRWLGKATVHVQTEPLCRRHPEADHRVPPIARPPRRSRAEVRAGLGIGPAEPVVVLTMGGVAQPLPFLDRLHELAPIRFLVTGMDRTRREGTLHLFDNDTRIYLPDLIEAADGVVAKLGYSTVAEVWSAGAPLAWVGRDDFRETGPLTAWAEANLEGFGVPAGAFSRGDWLERIPGLVERGRASGPGRPGHGEGRPEGSEPPAARVAGVLSELGSAGR